MAETQPATVPASAITPKDMPTPTEHSPSTSAENGATGSPAPAAAPVADTPRDSAGVPYDAAKHIQKTNRHTGRWMPRGGRRAGVSPSAAPAPVASAPKPTESFIPAKVPAAPAESGSADAVKPAAPAAVVDHSTDAGEVLARATQLTAGVILDAPKEATASPAEHKHMVEATAAYIRSKNWQAAAGIGLLLMFAAWLLKVMQQPGPQAKVRGWLHSEPAPGATQPESTGGHGKAAATPAPAAAAGGDVQSNVPPLAPR